MAHSLSAKKRIRQNEKSRLRNKARKSALRTETKKFMTAVEAGDADAARELMPKVEKAYAQTAAKGVIHKNMASRKVSRLAKKLNDLESKDQ